MGFFSDNIPNELTIASDKAKEIMEKLMRSVKRTEKKKAEEENFHLNMEATQNQYFDNQKNL